MRVNKSRENPPGEKERKRGAACAGFCLPYNRYVAVLEPCVWRVASVRVIEAAKAVGTVAFVHDYAFVPLFCSTLYITRAVFDIQDVSGAVCASVT